jgi:hypothetical protein
VKNLRVDPGGRRPTNAGEITLACASVLSPDSQPGIKTTL